MRRKFGLLFVTLLIGLLTAQSVLASSGPAPVIFSQGGPPATTITSYNLSCSSLTVTGNSPAPYVDVEVDTSNPTSSAVTVFSVSNGTYTATVNFPDQPTGAAISFFVWGAPTSVNHAYNDLDWSLVAPATCPASWPSSAGGVTWFNPGDGRIDGQPGDRVAVWCNTTATPPNLVVYGVGDATNGSHGFWLATFNNADLLKAGKVGITKNAGAGNGSISAMNDGNGNFWVAWNGGIFNATGNPPFAKSFSCQF